MKANFDAISEATPAFISESEKAAINIVLHAGENYGYGNMIAWLKTAWAKNLIADGVSEKTARKHSGGSGYPFSWIEE